LKKDGSITTIGLNTEPCIEIAKIHGFSVMHEREVMQGKELCKVYCFKR
jgi:hypothetical protein